MTGVRRFVYGASAPHWQQAHAPPRALAHVAGVRVVRCSLCFDVRGPVHGKSKSRCTIMVGVRSMLLFSTECNHQADDPSIAASGSPHRPEPPACENARICQSKTAMARHGGRSGLRAATRHCNVVSACSAMLAGDAFQHPALAQPWSVPANVRPILVSKFSRARTRLGRNQHNLSRIRPGRGHAGQCWANLGQGWLDQLGPG